LQQHHPDEKKNESKGKELKVNNNKKKIKKNLLKNFNKKTERERKHIQLS